MSVVEKAVAWALSVADSPANGYDQTNRWGPDYDCSSFVISAFSQAGLPVREKGATYTGNMRPAFLAAGFRDVTGSVQRATGTGLQRGDVLLNIAYHTALHIGSGRLVQAAGNEKGGITGGKPGDQTGGEIGTAAYYDYPWDCILRYTGDDAGTEPDPGGTYTVQAGDTLSGIALRLLGDAQRYKELAALNKLADPSKIYPGQVLTLPGGGTETGKGEITLPVIREGDAGGAVLFLQLLLIHKWAISCGAAGADGEFGPDTAAAVRSFQTVRKLGVTGVVDAGTWQGLLG